VVILAPQFSGHILEGIMGRDDTK